MGVNKHPKEISRWIGELSIDGRRSTLAVALGGGGGGVDGGGWSGPGGEEEEMGGKGKCR